MHCVSWQGTIGQIICVLALLLFYRIEWVIFLSDIILLPNLCLNVVGMAKTLSVPAVFHV